ncbi:mycofactocin-coupled SDR family oxidoreductase [Pseudonocardia oroxyli]|uniref:(+)-trans-carveol dehydrogenase n=1 Tax=Pseudonocardia oroxyli TaxID=366584 RepID=A0A1G8DWH3_PSEOR|nr:mycofactocin-coupled SDR family oxidoreductase [Pseudonocardia oroxyli]SDH62033.1 (+)-trans-carveol dehydrogenase [Pseudonocardia oroxyli]
MGRVDGKVAFVTGAARGMGRSHAVRLAEEGADVIAIDLCEQVETVLYGLPAEADLAQTVKEVEARDRRCVALKADVRDLAALTEAARQGVAELGPIDIVVANAGVVASPGPALDIDEKAWQTVIDIDLTGVWKTVKATVPAMVERGQGGSVVLISSGAGLVALPGVGHYVAAKHGVTGLMRSLAVELAPHDIRVNSVHPGTVDTPGVANDSMYKLLTGGIDGATREQAAASMRWMNALDVPWIEPRDISNAVLHLASEEARYTTGTTMVVDAGSILPFKIPHPT